MSRLRFVDWCMISLGLLLVLAVICKNANAYECRGIDLYKEVPKMMLPGQVVTYYGPIECPRMAVIRWRQKGINEPTVTHATPTQWEVQLPDAATQAIYEAQHVGIRK